MKRPDGHYTTCPNEDCPDIQCRDRRRHEARIKELEEELLVTQGYWTFHQQQSEAWQKEFYRSERHRNLTKKDVRFLEKEVSELKYLLNHINSFVVPGDTDSIDSLKALFKELEELRAKK